MLSPIKSPPAVCLKCSHGSSISSAHLHTLGFAFVVPVVNFTHTNEIRLLTEFSNNNDREKCCHFSVVKSHNWRWLIFPRLSALELSWDPSQDLPGVGATTDFCQLFDSFCHA